MTTRFHLSEPGLSRTGRWCLVLDVLLLLLLMFWLSWSPRAYEQGPPVELGVARIAADEPHNPVDDFLVLSVTRDGRVWCGREPLDRLGEWLDRRILAYDEERRAEGKSGFEDVGGGACASRLYVILRIDRATPWRAAYETVRRVGQSSLYKVYLQARNEGGRRTYLSAFLPTAGMDYAYITARVGRDGGVSLDGREVPDPTQAIKASYRSIEDFDRAVAGLIDADPAVPFGEVIRALDAFACAGMAKVDLAADSVRAVVVPRPR